MSLGLFGGAFDPPHNGHVALVRAAKKELGLARVVVIVVAEPGHKHVRESADARLVLARAAFPDDEVVLDDHARTIDMLRDHPEWHGATFLLGADEGEDFSSWKEPDEVLKLVTIGVAARPGHAIEPGERMVAFELDEPVASRDLRERLEAGEDVRELIPTAVWDEIERAGLYGRNPRYTETA